MKRLQLFLQFSFIFGQMRSLFSRDSSICSTNYYRRCRSFETKGAQGLASGSVVFPSLVFAVIPAIAWGGKAPFYLEHPGFFWSFIGILASLTAVFFALYLNIRRRLHIERRLLESEGKYRRITDNARDMIYRMSLPSGKYEYISPASIEISGYTPEEFYQNPLLIRDIIHPDWHDYFKNAWEDLLAGKVPASYEYQAVSKSGEIKWFYQRNVLIMEEGEPVAIEGIVTDITARKNFEAALLESERKYRELVENANSIILRMDSVGTIKYINEFALEFFGFEENELVGKNVVGTIVPETESTGRDLREMIQGIGLQPEMYGANENENIRRNGERVWVAWTNKAIFDEAGNIAQILCVGSDISDIKRLEEKLRESQKMEAVGRLAGGIAHDFNNLLTAINGYAEMLTSRLDPNGRAYREASEILKAGEKAAGLTGQLLAFGQKQILAPKTLEVNRFLADMEDKLVSAAGPGIAIEFELSPQAGAVKADPYQIELVIMNLVKNSARSIPGEGKIIISSGLENWKLIDNGERVRSKGGPFTMIAVEDNGPGMDKETAAKIFEPFFTTKEMGNGSGLGLSSVYGIIEQSGGHVMVSSEPGKGSRFEVFLPALSVPPTARAVAADSEALMGKETILLIEAEDAVRELIREILESRGYKVITAEDVDSAVQICSHGSESIDLVLSDYNIGGEPGKGAAEACLESLPRAKILYMSCQPQAGEKAYAWECIGKPFHPDELLAKVRSVIDGK